jgi:hypothetical protein
VALALDATKVSRIKRKTSVEEQNRNNGQLEVIEEFSDIDHTIRLQAAKMAKDIHDLDPVEGKGDGEAREQFEQIMTTLHHIRANTARELPQAPPGPVVDLVPVAGPDSDK